MVSDTRVTGEREELPGGLAELVAAVRAEAPVPAAVGFGIGTPDQAAAVGQIADGVIVGTRLVRAVAEARRRRRPPRRLAISSARRASRWPRPVVRWSRFPAVQLLVFTVVGLAR